MSQGGRYIFRFSTIGREDDVLFRDARRGFPSRGRETLAWERRNWTIYCMIIQSRNKRLETRCFTFVRCMYVCPVRLTPIHARGCCRELIKTQKNDTPMNLFRVPNWERRETDDELSRSTKTTDSISQREKIKTTFHLHETPAVGPAHGVDQTIKPYTCRRHFQHS